MKPLGLVDRSLVGDLGLAAASTVALAVVMVFVFSDADASVSGLSPRHEAIGSIARRSNHVRRRVDGDLVWNGIGHGATVYQSDAIFVGADSDAVVILDDGSRIEIDESSMVVIRRVESDVADAEPVVDVQILRGGARGRAGRRRLALRAGKSATQLSGGAEARVRLRKDRTAQVMVSKGKAIVSGENGGSVEVGEGQRRTVSAAGQSIGDVELLALKLNQPADGARLYIKQAAPQVELFWHEAAGKGPYVVEIATGPDFETLVFRARTKMRRVAAGNLGAGVYYWRVERGTKGGGRLASEERKLTLIEDRPPVPYRPLADSIVDLSAGRALSLAWGAVPDVEHYVVEVTRGSNFKTPLFSLRIDRPSHLLRSGDYLLQEDDHCFRVRSDEQERGVSPWSRPVCFRIVTSPVLPPPILEDPVREDEKPGQSGERGNFLLRFFIGTAHAAQPTNRQVLLRWKKLSGAVSYVIEIADDRSFAKIVIEKKVDENYFRWKPPERREYFWRVRGIDADGRAGKVSSSRTVGVDIPGPPPRQPALGAKIEFASAPPRVTLRWQAEDRYVSYLVQLARNATFSAGTSQIESSGSSAEYRPAALGDYHWRIIGIRSNGERSLPGPASSFSVIPAAPKLLEPVEGVAVPIDDGKALVELKWSKRPVKRFEIQVAKDGRFRMGVVRQSSAKPSATVELGEVSKYFWRVRATDPASSWSKRADFAVVPVPPDMLEPTDGAELVLMQSPLVVTLRWAEVATAQSYRVTFGPEVDASAPKRGAVTPIEVEGLQTPVEISAAGRYRWSVRAVLESGIESAASPSWSFKVGQVVVAIDPLPALCAEGQVCIDGTGCQGEKTCNDQTVAVPIPDAPVLYAGPRLGLVYNLGEITTGAVSAEVGYRLPQLARRVGVALSIGYYTDPLDFVNEANRVFLHARLHALPVELVAVYILSMPVVDLVAGGGIAMTYTYTTIRVTDLNDREIQPAQSANHFAIGGVVRIGAERELGPGRIFADLSFGIGTRSRGLVETQSTGMILAVGFRVFVW